MTVVHESIYILFSTLPTGIVKSINFKIHRLSGIQTFVSGAESDNRNKPLHPVTNHKH